MMRRTIYLRIAYEGTDFHGWQEQPGLRTVQGVLEDAIRRVVRHPVELIGSGRTDEASAALLGAAQEQVPQIPCEMSLFERLPQCELCTLFMLASLPPLLLRLLPAGATSCRVGIAPTEDPRLRTAHWQARLHDQEAPNPKAAGKHQQSNCSTMHV